MKEKFSSEYHKLKGEEKWAEIITLGEKLLSESKKLSDTDRALIHNRLASSNFYLGEYDKALKSSTAALEAATRDSNKNQEARALYLISAVYRVKKDIPNSESYIKKALAIADDKGVSKFTKAKIYFNSGALYQDLMNDPQKASKHYAVASANFAKDSDDYVRTEIRNIRCDLETGKPNAAKIKAEGLTVQPGTKTFVHLLQLRTKIGMALEQYGEAHKFASEAIKVAKDKGMAKECEMLQKLIDEIAKKAPNIVASSGVVSAEIGGVAL